jgi:8-oxo-dGTP pyrophosphatase MutT (NUDIX family)
MTALLDDAVRVLTSWTAPDPESAAAAASTLDLLDAGPVATTRAHQTGHLTASGLIVSHDLQRVLLCLHGRLGVWVQVGGHCEPDDLTLTGAALREATEESGISDLAIHPVPIHVSIHPVHCTVGRSRHFDVRFALLAPADAEERVSAESDALGWFAPDDLPEPLATATSCLVQPALRAFATAQPA